MLRLLLSVACCITMGINSYAQISFQNPSMEGLPCWGYCYAYDWAYCNTCSVLINTDSIYWQEFFYTPSFAYSGNTYMVIENQTIGGNDQGDLSQKLDCPFIAEQQYFFTLWAASWRIDDTSNTFYEGGYGQLSIYLGSDSCDKAQLIHRSSLLDTVWSLQQVNFIPNANYNWISFWPEKDDTIPIVDIAIDAFSPIYLTNAHAVNLNVTDTLISAGGCISVTATVNISTADTIYWLRVNSSHIDTFGLGQYTQTLCPNATTTYIVALRNSVIGCAGVEWSYDTIRVEVPLGIGETSIESLFEITPNPATNFTTITHHLLTKNLKFEVTNLIGQRVTALQEFTNSHHTINTTELQAGVYLIHLYELGHLLQTKKLMIVK